MVHRLSNDYFLLVNDTLCHFTTKYTVPIDSIRNIYKSDLKYEVIDNMVKEVSYQALDTLFSCSFFNNDNFVKEISNNGECKDIITLHNYWTIGEKKYYQFSIKYNCGLSELEDWYIIDHSFEFHSFNTKYYSAIGKKLKNMKSEIKNFSCK